MNNDEKIIVSVWMTSYNHEKYLPQAIEGVLMQKTNFKYELIIHDDASTDSSQDVIRFYEKQHPDIIKAIYQTENQYSKHDGSIGKLRRKIECGKYTAFCEGDDYWTDENKLQKQVDFLENHSDYMACYGNIRCVDADGVYRESLQIYKKKDAHTITLEDFINCWNEEAVIGQTATLIFKNPWSMLEGISEAYDKCQANGDEKLSLLLSYLGKVYFMEDCFADHRRVFVGDSWTARTCNVNICKNDYKRKENLLNLLDSLVEMEKTQKKTIHANAVKYDRSEILNYVVASAWVYAFKNHKKGDFKIAIELMRENGNCGGVFFIIMRRMFRKLNPFN